MGMIWIDRVDLEPEDIPPGWNAPQERVNCFEACPDFSDKAWHFRGYVVIEHLPWMDARPDIYVKQDDGFVHLRQSFVNPIDWKQLERAAWRDQTMRRWR